MVGGISPTAKVATVPEQKKENFNFMQINLSPKEKQEVEKLKEQLKSSETPK
jgi:predicted CopG family antitoxin